MKFEAMSFHKTTLDHYKKRGIYGFCIQFYLLHNDIPEDDNIVGLYERKTQCTWIKLRLWELNEILFLFIHSLMLLWLRL